MLEPLTRETLPAQASRTLKRYILERQLNPGDQLPSERFLTEMLGVSRTVVREALHRLVTEGLLVKEAGRGVFVREFDPHELEAQSALATDTVASYRALMEVRAVLEIGALAFIAQRVTASELDRLDQIVSAMRQALEAGQSIAEMDRDFHDALLEAMRNPTFAYFKRLIQDAAGSSARNLLLVSPRPTDRNTVETAERIAAALRQRNADEAQRAMRSHLLVERPPDHAHIFLFVDDGNVAEMRSVKRRIAPAHKFPHNPLIGPEHPWEGESVFPSATVLYDATQMSYRMWYHGSRQLSPREELCSLCYATSSDGIHWTKPALNIFPYVPPHESGNSLNGQTNGLHDTPANGRHDTPGNNLVMPWGNTVQGDVVSATILPVTTPGQAQQQYRMLYLAVGAPRAGVGVAGSADGLHWTHSPENPVTDGTDPAALVGDALVCIAEPKVADYAARELDGTGEHKFTAYYRLPLRVAAQPTLGRMQSNDLRHWTGHRAVLSTDAHDGPDAELHGLTPFRYGDLTLGLLWMHRRKARRGEFQLVSSRDGVEWTRVGDRTPLLESGPPGTFDHAGITRATIPVVVGNELWFYYAGLDDSNDSGTPREQIGLATLTLDRFVALEAGRTEGYVITTPIDCSMQTHLFLNAVVNPRGYVLVEVLDGTASARGTQDEMKPIPGFTRDDAIPFHGNAVYHRVSWRDHEDLSALGDRPVRLRFILRQAAIYGFRLAHPDASVTDLVAAIC